MVTGIFTCSDNVGGSEKMLLRGNVETWKRSHIMKHVIQYLVNDNMNPLLCYLGGAGIGVGTHHPFHLVKDKSTEGK